MEANWIAVIVVVVSISLAIAPIYWMRPSDRQRQLARLRTHALSLGLQPELREVPTALRLAGWDDKLMRYQRYRPGTDWPRGGPCWLAMRAGPKTGDEGFVWAQEVGYRDGPAALLTSLQDLARLGLIAVEVGPAGLGFYWHEKGGPDTIDTLVAALDPWLAGYQAQALGRV